MSQSADPNPAETAPTRPVALLDQCNDTQRRLLETLMLQPDGLYVDDLAAPLGVTISAVRQHLATLETQGLVASERVARGRGRGRPRHIYRLTRSGREAFPRRYDALAMSMISELVEQLGPDELPQAMRRMGRRAAEAVDAPAALSVSDLAGLMGQIGYAAHSEPGDGDGDDIVAMNCVFHRLAQEHSAVCEFDLEFMRAATGRAVEHRECMVRGGSRCRFSFSSNQQPDD